MPLIMAGMATKQMVTQKVSFNCTNKHFIIHNVNIYIFRLIVNYYFFMIRIFLVMKTLVNITLKKTTTTRQNSP